MAKKRANCGIVVRDIIVALLDVAGAWTYLVYMLGRKNSVRRHAQYAVALRVELAVCLLGTLLSAWAIATSYGRIRQYKSLCCRCTVPRLGGALIVLHQVPQFILTTCVDLTYHDADVLTWAGWLNVGSSLVAFVNTLAMTDHGDTAACGSSDYNNQVDDVELGSAKAKIRRGEATNDYKAMPLT